MRDISVHPKDVSEVQPKFYVRSDTIFFVAENTLRCKR